MEHVYIFVVGNGIPRVHYHMIGRYLGAPRKYWGPRVDEWPEAPKGGKAEIARVTARLRDFLKENYADER